MNFTTSPFILAGLNSDVDLDIQNCAFPNFTVCIFEWPWQFRLSPAVHDISFGIWSTTAFLGVSHKNYQLFFAIFKGYFQGQESLCKAFPQLDSEGILFVVSSDGNTEWQVLFLMCHGTPKTWRSQKSWYLFLGKIYLTFCSPFASGELTSSSLYCIMAVHLKCAQTRKAS